MTTHKLNLTADWIPDAWIIDRMRREREEREQRERPFLEMPHRSPEPQPEERQEAPEGSTVIIIDL